MKRILLLFVGLIPLPVGYVLNHLVLTRFYYTRVNFALLGLLFLLVWSFIGLIVSDPSKSIFNTAVIVHIPALFVLCLALFQEFIVGHFWSNFVGFSVQIYYLTLLNISSKIAVFTNTMGEIFVFAFLEMFLCFYLGAYMRQFSVCVFNENIETDSTKIN